MKIRKYLMGYDSYERHRMVAKLVEPESRSILDVGGGHKQLAQFINKTIISANLQEGDVRASGLYLPFSDSAFDTVTSLDVLEHVPPGQRCAFVKELVRVCRNQVVVCAPYGSAEHMAGEKILLDRILREGSVDKMLEEHVENGLPKMDTFKSCLSEQISIQAWFSGYYQYNIFCFHVDHLFGVDRFKWVKVFLAMFLNLFGNLVIFPISLSRLPRANANRMYVVLNKS
ncbi:MAG: class I SAM-dependent methyltransferase [Anaerolineales bacterium]|nr:class I SAM-dependent methyltransferase [Anaerolineales bacterium]